MNKTEQLIDTLYQMQVSENTHSYNSGMFKTQRRHRFFKYEKEDSNIYYSAIIAFTLQPFLKDLPTDQKKRLQKIINPIKNNYHLYESRSIPGIYNFYQTNPSKHYPNGHILSRFKHFILADDADDTVIINMTMDSLTQKQINAIRSQLIKFSNLKHKQIANTLPKYKNLPAYGVWFGSGAMPIEFELCVMTNIMYFTFKNNCDLNVHDLATLEYINQAVADKDIYNTPYIISCQYPFPSVMLYHIARLCSVMKTPGDHLPVSEIISGLRKKLSEAQNITEKLFLCSALMKMGVETPNIKYQLKDLKEEFEKLSFFVAPMLSGTGNLLLNFLAKFEFFHIKYVCDSYYLTLALEYELLKNNF